ncbi:MAG: right-handed parallel beta-helix repeat-containing protein [Chitinispirillaceae bacterium]|nr:right-handed parallel beta-helix repeat-containing protein [Chitinispirillaceae bacterium]
MKSRKNRRLYLLRGAVAIYAIVFFCIERDNPWDPYNSPDNGCLPEELLELQEYFTREIDKLRSNVSSLLQVAWTGFQSQIATNSSYQNNNDTALQWIGSRHSMNDRIDARNRKSGNCDSAEFKYTIAPVTLFPMLFDEDIDSSGLFELMHVKDSVDVLVRRARDTCPEQVVLTEGYVNSVNRSFTDLNDKWDSLFDSISRYNARMIAYNRTINIDSVNRQVCIWDSLTAHYNDSLLFCRLPWIDDTTGIQHRIDSIEPGDTIAFEADSVRVGNFRFIEKGAAGVWTVIIGNPKTKTIISSGGAVEIINSYNIKFVNLTFTDIGNEVGARVTNNSNDITFSHCIFRNNRNKGLEATECGNITIDNCLFLYNGNDDTTAEALINMAALRFADCRDTIAVMNSIIAHNTGVGIDISSSDITMRCCTISDNSLDGVRYTGPTSTGRFVSYSSLYTFNGQYGIYRNDQRTTRDIFVSSESDNRFFGNVAGEMGGDSAIAEDNKPFVNVDPKYVDRGNGDYRIGAESPLFGTGIGYQY